MENIRLLGFTLGFIVCVSLIQVILSRSSSGQLNLIPWKQQQYNHGYHRPTTRHHYDTEETEHDDDDDDTKDSTGFGIIKKSKSTHNGNDSTSKHQHQSSKHNDNNDNYYYDYDDGTYAYNNQDGITNTDDNPMFLPGELDMDELTLLDYTQYSTFSMLKKLDTTDSLKKCRYSNLDEENNGSGRSSGRSTV